MAWFEGVKHEYKTHRQWQIGKGLDALQRQGLLSWHFLPSVPTVDYFVSVNGHPEKVLKTKEAENMVQLLANQAKIIWLPVGGGGGKSDWELVKTRIQLMADGIEPPPWEQ